MWYAVPHEQMDMMERLWKTLFPHLFARHPDLCYWKTCLFSPAALHSFGIKVYRATHEAGTFIFTTPAAYHSGFNTGLNVAESTNFAFADWMEVKNRFCTHCLLLPVAMP